MDEKERELVESEGGIVDESEERIIVKPFWGWSLLMLLCIWILGWGMFIMMGVKDIERRWDFGQYEDTPGSSVLSTSDQDFSKGPEQLRLPENLNQKEKKPKEKSGGSRR